jgi:hypothetical protein
LNMPGAGGWPAAHRTSSGPRGGPGLRASP